MNIYSLEKNQEIAEAIEETIERETGQKVFTIRILSEIEEGLEVLIVLKNKNVLMGLVSILEVEDKIACRIQANYI